MKVLIYGENISIETAINCVNFDVDTTFTTDLDKATINSIKSNSIDLAVVDSISKLRVVKNINPNLYCYIAVDVNWTDIEALLTKYPFSISFKFSSFIDEQLEMEIKMLQYVNSKCNQSTNKIFSKKDCPIYIQTFGYFDLFLYGECYYWKSAKAKELLAVLIDQQGASVNNEQICTYLWDDRPYDVSTQNLCSKIKKTLIQVLKDIELEHIIRYDRNYINIKTEELKCDLYDALNGDPFAKQHYIGQYMKQYTWAEETVGLLDNTLK